MKSFQQLISEVAQPKAGDEINFKAKHEIEMYDYPVDVVDQFKSKKSKAAKRRADYDKDEDEGVYEAKLDPVDKKAVNKPFRMRKDKDIDNDGDVDSSDRYLHTRRAAVTRAIKKMKESAELEEAAKIACMKCDEVSTAAAWKKNGGFCPKCKVSSQGVAESVEQLDELSPNTLHRYIKGASKDLAKRSNMSGYDARSGAYNNALKNKKKANKRLSGITSASGRLADKANSDMYEDAWEEIPMMTRQLAFIEYAAEEISDYLSMDIDPEEWFQNKLAHIHGQMQSLHAYIEGDKRMMGAKMKYSPMGENLDEANDSKAFFNVAKKLRNISNDAATIASNASRKRNVTKTIVDDLRDDIQALHNDFGYMINDLKKIRLDEVTRSAVKRPIQYTDAQGVTPTRLTTTKPVRHDQRGQEKITEAAMKPGTLKLDDGSSVTVKKQDAELLNDLFKDLNAQNRKQMMKVAMKDKAGFEEILGFAREAL